MLNRGKPLEGKRVVVTRAREQAHELSEPLRAYGAIPVEWPIIEIAPPADTSPLDEAIQHLEQYDWVIFSSFNGVKYFLERAASAAWRFPRIATVGSKTAAALRNYGLHVDAVPDEFLATQLVSALGDVRGQRILLVRPEFAPDDLPVSLRARGAHVDEVVAYRTLPVEYQQPLVLDQIDAVTLASASAATHFAKHILTIPRTICIASIGPSTSKAARQVGLRVDVEAPVHTLEGLVRALVSHFHAVEVAP